MNLKGKTALITRAADPLAAGIGYALAKAGANILLAYEEGTERDEMLVNKFRQIDRQAFAISYDAATPEQASQLIAQAVDLLGKIDVIVLLPCRVSTKPFLDQCTADWETILNQNFGEMLYVSQAAARQMMAGKVNGRIIFISSAASEMPLYETSLMGTSLAALNWLAKCAAIELGPHGITVNVVAPGWVETERKNVSLFATTHSTDEPGLAYLSQGIPLQRMGKASEVGQVCAFLASESASYVTGIYLPVDGGYAMAKEHGNTPYPDHEPWPTRDAGFDYTHLIAK